MFKPNSMFFKLGLLFWTLSANTSFSQIKSKDYLVSIGNHSSLKISVSDDSFTQIYARLQTANGKENEFLFKADQKEMILTSNSQQTILHPEQTEAYNQSLRDLRDLLAYAAGPERYDWLVFGPSILNPELNESIKQIDLQLSKEPALNVNCQILTQDPAVGVWTISGGTFGDLGHYSQTIDSVWVRQGYELMLSTGLEFATEGASLVRARGKDPRAQTELLPIEAVPAFGEAVDTAAGTAYSLQGSALAAAARSLICRPFFR